MIVTTLVVLDGLLLGTKLLLEIGSVECSTSGTKDDNVDGLFLVS